jgi:predicted transcriptional regulator
VGVRLSHIVLHWQVDHIRKGLREAESGKFVSGAGVKKVIARLRRK